MTRTTVSYLAAITAALGVSALVFIAPSSATNAQTPQEQRDVAFLDFLGELTTAAANYHHSMLATIPVEKRPLQLPRRIWIDAQFGDAAMAVAAAHGDTFKAGRVSSRQWTTDDARAVVSLDKWREYLQRTELRNDQIMFGDWEIRELLTAEPERSQDFVAVGQVARAYRPGVLWSWYTGFGKKSDPHAGAIRDDCDFFVVSIYLKGAEAEDAATARAATIKTVTAALEEADGRPVLVEHQGRTLVNGIAVPIDEVVQRASLDAALELQVDGDRVDGIILFDNTRNAWQNKLLLKIPDIKSAGDVDRFEQRVYEICRAALDGLEE